MAEDKLESSILRPEWNRSPGQEEQEMAQNMWPAVNNCPPSERELLEQGLKIIRKYTDQLEWQHRLIGLPLMPSGLAEGIIWGWLMEAEVLLRKLHALMEEMVEEKKIPEVAVLEAHIAIRYAVNNLRPGVCMVPNFLAAPMGARAELGQAYVACGHMVQGLAQLLQGSGGSGNSFPIQALR